MRRETWGIVAVAAFAVVSVPAQMVLGAITAPSGGAVPAGLDAASVRREYAALPLAFEENRGQVDPGAGFVARGSGYAFLVGATGATLEFTPGGRRGRSAKPAAAAAAATAPPVDVLRIELVGADPAARVSTEQPAGHTGSFLGSDPRRWRTAVPDYGRVVYRGVYPGIDLIYHGLQGSLEYDFDVAPGADPRDIRLRVDGGTPSLGGSGEMALALPGGTAVQPPAVAFQPAAHPSPRAHPTTTLRPPRSHAATPRRRPAAAPATAARPVATGYVLGRGGEVRIALGDYDRSRPLVVDPVITWSPAVGGGLDDSFVSTVDDRGSAYVVTGTPSPDLGAAGAAVTDVAVLKLDPAGGVLYRTFLGGGDGGSGPSEVAVDDTGALEVSGEVGPVTGGPTLVAGGPQHGYTMRLDADGLPLPRSGAAPG